MANGRLAGVLAAVVTPVTAKGDPDAGLFAEVAGRLLDGGCDGLNVLGTTGEATSFGIAQRLKLMQAASQSLPCGRFMVGTGAAAVAEAAQLTRTAGELGFGGALVLPPFYYKGVGDDGVLRYLDRVLAESAESAIPIYLYHFPAQSGVPYGDGLLDRIQAAFGARIAGLKDSSGDMDYARRQAQRRGFDVFPSTEACLTEARSGAFAGCISATANVTSEFCGRVWRDGDAAAQAKATALRTLVATRPLVPAVKAMVAHRLGLPAVAATLPPLSDLPVDEARALARDFEVMAQA